MSKSKPVVLCVDDDPDVRYVLRGQLEVGGYEVVEAENCEKALAAFESRRPDVLIIDLMMEELDSGLSLVRNLHARGNTSPVFLLSSQGDNLAKTTDLAPLRVAGVLQKPVKTDVLLPLVKANLAQSS